MQNPAHLRTFRLYLTHGLLKRQRSLHRNHEQLQLHWGHGTLLPSSHHRRPLHHKMKFGPTDLNATPQMSAATAKLTELEYQVLRTIVHGKDPVDNPVWSSHEFVPQLVGAYSSCIKKGYIGTGPSKAEDATMWITRKGMDAYLEQVTPYTQKDTEPGVSAMERLRERVKVSELAKETIDTNEPVAGVWRDAQPKTQRHDLQSDKHNPTMKIVLADISPALCREWERAFAGVPDVTVHNGAFEEADHTEAIVSPANSFGHMGGGIDGAYTAYFGRGLQAAVQAVIVAHHDGELPVGKAFSVPIPGNSQSWLIVAPTMRVPSLLEGTPNVFLSARAAFREALKRGFASVLVPGMGTGAGGVNPATCADHMRAGYDAAIARPLNRTLRFGEAAAELMKYVVPSPAAPAVATDADPMAPGSVNTWLNS